MRKWDVAVVGATGAVGRALLTLLEKHAFPIRALFLLASARSEGMKQTFQGKSCTVEALDTFDFQKVQLAFFTAGAIVSSNYVEKAVKAGCIVIDNTSYFRLEKDIPLVVPEVNAEDVKRHSKRAIIANPNCSTIQMVVALKPLYDAVGITRVNVVTYQAVSGTGLKALSELHDQTRRLLNQEDKTTLTSTVYPVPIAFNVIPQAGVFEENGYTQEEMKIVRETRKILHDESIQVNPTAVRVPVSCGHALAVHVETKDKLTAHQARQLLATAPGVTVKDERVNGGYPTPLLDAEAHNTVWVGRIREDISHPLGLNLWVVADNLLKGAAWNSLQIATLLS